MNNTVCVKGKNKASFRVINGNMVRAAGLEPALPYGNKILSLACLPIPPRPHCALYVFARFGGNMANNFLNTS